MTLQPIQTHEDYLKAKEKLAQLSDKTQKCSSLREIETLRIMIENYEQQHAPESEPNALLYMDAFYYFCEGMLRQMGIGDQQADLPAIRSDKHLQLELMRDIARALNRGDSAGWDAALEGVDFFIDRSDHADTSIYRIQSGQELQKYFMKWLSL